MIRAGQLLGSSLSRSIACLCATLSFLTVFCPKDLMAQENPASVTSDLEKIKQENEALRDQLKKQTETVDTLIKRIEDLENTTLKSAITLGDEFDSIDLNEELKAPRNDSWLNLQLFGDVGYRVGGAAAPDGSRLPNTFTIGQLDLLATAQLSERFSVLSEIVFQYKSTEASSTTIERLQLQYNATDLFNFRVGRTHTPFGYWNETYHHGTWFQTTILRPEILRFHDGGGILPIHSVGVEMFGYQPFNPLDVHYNFGIANGRGAMPHDTQNFQDLNGNKALYGVLSLAPAAVPGLRLGFNGYGDTIPGDPVTHGEIDELILGGHIVYLHNNIEFLSEGDHIRHNDRVSGQTFNTWGMYAQAGYQLGPVKPYLRYDYMDVDPADPFYATVASIRTVTRYTAGVRWDPINWVAFKLEYQYIDQSGLNNPNAFYSQATFTY